MSKRDSTIVYLNEAGLELSELMTEEQFAELIGLLKTPSQLPMDERILEAQRFVPRVTSETFTKVLINILDLLDAVSIDNEIVVTGIHGIADLSKDWEWFSLCYLYMDKNAYREYCIERLDDVIGDVNVASSVKRDLIDVKENIVKHWNV